MIDPPPGDEREDPQDQSGRLQPTSPKVLTVWFLVGLVGGWLFHAYADRRMTAAPLVSWGQPLALFLVAGILAVTARATWRIMQDRPRSLSPQQAVNRLVLARACAYVGILVSGAYLGYALSWVGVSAELAEQRVVRSLIAGLGGVSVVVTALLLERACRVRKGEDDA